MSSRGERRWARASLVRRGGGSTCPPSQNSICDPDAMSFDEGIWLRATKQYVSQSLRSSGVADARAVSDKSTPPNGRLFVDSPSRLVVNVRRDPPAIRPVNANEQEASQPHHATTTPRTGCVSYQSRPSVAAMSPVSHACQFIGACAPPSL